MVKKANGKWRMCVNFTNLNKACPKDSYPLPRINVSMDSIARHQLLSFMNAFSGYNQIKLDEADQEKTSFVISQGLFCYKVMPFNLKNAGVTYQRLMNKMFAHQIGRNVQVYVDDMLVKIRPEDDHLDDLKETFNTFRSYNIKLNPSKCAFGVTARKFLRFMMSQRGIEINPDKIQTIIEMAPPRNIKEVQSLNNKVVALNRFMSRATDKCLPFFHTLKKSFRWTVECQQTFEDLKAYLSSLPLLSPSKAGKELFLYLAISLTTVSAALVREEDRVHKSIYYTSKALRSAEERYPPIEKLAFALVTTVRKLKPYFQAHTMIVLIAKSLRRAMSNPEAAGRMMIWVIKLSEFNVQYHLRTAMKEQMVVDFIAEFTNIEGQGARKHPQWSIHMDRSFNGRTGGASTPLPKRGRDRVHGFSRLPYDQQ